MSTTKFIAEGPDKKGRIHIIEGTPKGRDFIIEKFICEVQQQETEADTKAVADFLVQKLNA